jgi:hypothetical protein
MDRSASTMDMNVSLGHQVICFWNIYADASIKLLIALAKREFGGIVLTMIILGENAA